jgi:4a-hydroxytetrahydrobiopterin dehydratase
MILSNKKCRRIEGDTARLPDETEWGMLVQIPGWELHTRGTHRISRHFSFRNYISTVKFANRIAEIADDEKHYPDLHISRGRVKVELHTRTVAGLTENDFILAAKIDRLRELTV